MSGDTFIYVIGGEATPFVKIGIARDPLGRIRQLQTGSPQTLALLRRWGPMPRKVAVRLEGDAHFILGDFREQGEWFRVTAEEAAHAVWGAAEGAHIGRDISTTREWVTELVFINMGGGIG